MEVAALYATSAAAKRGGSDLSNRWVRHGNWLVVRDNFD